MSENSADRRPRKDESACRSRCAAFVSRDAAQLSNIGGKVRRKLRLDSKGFASGWMDERELPRMEKHPAQSSFCQFVVPGEVTVFIVARERKSEMREMYPNLVRTPGPQLGFQ